MIDLPYLLVLNIPLHHHDGSYWADPLWKKDLEAHRVEISRLSIACPVVNGPPPARWTRLAAGIGVHSLPPMHRLSILLAPYLAVLLWRAITVARIVHVGVAGWPFPLGWLAIPLARLRGKRLVLVVESAFWRIPPGAAVSPLARLRASAWERINVHATAACDVCFFTTDAYKSELHRGPGVAYVLPAVWIDDDQLIDRDQLTETAPARRGILFAGRLTAAKGVALLLDAVERSGVAVDFIGEGDLHDTVLAAHRRRPDLVRLLDPVDYGPAFSALIDGYSALVVPTLTDEQPRVIFDAFARGVAVLASETTGNRQLIDHGRTGWLFAPGDGRALAAALGNASAHRDRLVELGVAAREEIAGRTHAAMHADRAGLIARALGRVSP